MRLRIWVFSICSLVGIQSAPIFAQAPNPGSKSPMPSVRSSAQSASAAKSVETTKRGKAQESLSTGAYGSVEMHHVHNRFDDSSGKAHRQESLGQFRLIIGYLSANSSLDLYATLGALKVPNSQQLVARRPEIEADLHFARSSDYDVLAYVINKMPWKDDALDPELELSQKRGSELAFGSRATFSNQRIPYLPSLSLFGGADVWTKFYSRRQYVTKKDPATERLTLVATEDGDPVEDNRQHLFSEFHLGMGFVPSWLQDLSIDAAGFYKRDFQPEYAALQPADDDRYSVQNTSYYRLRLNYRMSRTVEFANEFFHFHRGLFAAKTGEYDRRFRNLAKITYKF